MLLRIIVLVTLHILTELSSAQEMKQFETVCSEEVGRAVLKERSVGKFTGRIVFGQQAVAGQFPFLGYSVLYLNTGKMSLCGSSLISLNFVLTAAHCLQNIKAAQYFLGSTDNTNFPVMRNGISYVNHPLYDTPQYANDIALFQLQTPITPSATVAPIQLPRRSSSVISFEGLKMTAAGFGLNENGKLPRFLAYTTIVGMSDDQCRGEIGSTFVNTMICGKGVGMSSICQGDSGGPLVFNNTLVGVNNFGAGDASCISNLDGFCRVDRYLDWISLITGIAILT